MAGFYEPVKRSNHSTVLIEEQLYVWGGWQEGLPEVHSSPEKQQKTSSVDVFQCRLGMWEQHPTAGTPPLGVINSASCYIGRNIFYFGGDCGHDQCDHNSLSSLSMDELTWRELFPTSDITGPMRKSLGGLLTFHGQLLAVGGSGYVAPSNPSPSAKYDKWGNFVYTNEHHFYDRERAQWTIPTVTGNIPPPMSSFSFTQISAEQAVIFGGIGPGGDSANLYLATVGRDSVYWQRLAPHGPDQPLQRHSHAATCFTSSQLGLQSTLLLVIGGYLFADSWICEVGGKSVTWKEIKNVPDMVAKRRDHSISAVSESESCIWILVVGGQIMLSSRKDASPMVALLELKLTSKGDWEVTSVRHDKEICGGYVERFCQTFPAVMSAHIHKLQQQKESVQREVAQQLLLFQQQLQLAEEQHAENKKQVEELELCLKKRDDELQMIKKISRAKDSVLEQVQLRAKASEAALSELAEEKETLISDFESKVQASEVACSELARVKMISQELLFENSKLKQELDESQISPVKKPAVTCESAVQADYVSATEGPVMEELASTVLEMIGGKHQTHKWAGNGFRLTVPAGAVPKGTTISLAVRALLAESFELPENSQLISAIYWIAASQHFEQDVTLHLQHSSVIKSEAQCSQFKFVAGKCSQSYLPYLLKVREGGVFTPHSQEASISIKQFSFYGIVHEGDEDTNPFYYGQGFFRQRGQGQSWILDYTITCYIESLITWVQDNYESRGWSQHHEQLLEFDEAASESSQPAISLKVTEPASDQQKNWEVSFVSNIRFKKWMVDRITKKERLPFSRIGIKWMGQAGNIRPLFARKIDLLGMKGPDNYFQILLPEEALSTDAGREGTSSSRSHASSVSAGPMGVASPYSQPETMFAAQTILSPRTASLPLATLATLPDGSHVTPTERLTLAPKPTPMKLLDEDDLETVLSELNDVTDVEGLGLALGIRMSSLRKITLDNPKLEKQKTEVIYYWLTRRDIVRQRQKEFATWSGLADAVLRINPSLRDRICHQHY